MTSATDARHPHPWAGCRDYLDYPLRWVRLDITVHRVGKAPDPLLLVTISSWDPCCPFPSGQQHRSDCYLRNGTDLDLHLQTL